MSVMMQVKKTGNFGLWLFCLAVCLFAGSMVCSVKASVVEERGKSENEVEKLSCLVGLENKTGEAGYLVGQRNKAANAGCLTSVGNKAAELSYMVGLENEETEFKNAPGVLAAECASALLTFSSAHSCAIRIRTKKELVRVLAEGLERHQSEFFFHCPEIVKLFRTYGEKEYSDVYDKLSVKNGYAVGIVSGYTIEMEEEQYVTLHISYLTTKKQERYIDSRVKKLAKSWKGKRTVEKAKAAHDYLAKHMQYDERYNSPYTAFKKGKGVCMSYALCYQRLMQEMGIDCIYVTGRNHAWNMVKIGKYWYNVDVTWDDACGNYRYFLKCDSDFPGHKYNKPVWLKTLRKATRSYPTVKI